MQSRMKTNQEMNETITLLSEHAMKEFATPNKPGYHNFVLSVKAKQTTPRLKIRVLYRALHGSFLDPAFQAHIKNTPTCSKQGRTPFWGVNEIVPIL